MIEGSDIMELIRKRIVMLSRAVKVISKIMRITGLLFGGVLCYELIQVLREGAMPELISSFKVLPYEDLDVFGKVLFIWFGEKGVILFSLVQLLGIMLSMVMMFHFLQKVFETVENSGRPFDLSLLPYLKGIGVWLLIGMVLQNFLHAVIGVFVFVCLLEIYRYGCALQSESDETV